MHIFHAAKMAIDADKQTASSNDPVETTFKIKLKAQKLLAREKDGAYYQP